MIRVVHAGTVQIGGPSSPGRPPVPRRFESQHGRNAVKQSMATQPANPYVSLGQQ